MCLYLAKDWTKPTSDSFLNHVSLVLGWFNGTVFLLKCWQWYFLLEWFLCAHISSWVSINLTTYYFRKSLINVKEKFLYFLELLTPRGILRELHKFQNCMVFRLRVYTYPKGKSCSAPFHPAFLLIKTTLPCGSHGAIHLQCQLT